MSAPTTDTVRSGGRFDQRNGIDFAVADLSLAEAGRKEIRLAEHEMPGLMALRREYADARPLHGARVSGSCYMTVHDGGADRDLGSLGARCGGRRATSSPPRTARPPRSCWGQHGTRKSRPVYRVRSGRASRWTSTGGARADAAVAGGNGGLHGRTYDPDDGGTPRCWCTRRGIRGGGVVPGRRGRRLGGIQGHPGDVAGVTGADSQRWTLPAGRFGELPRRPPPGCTGCISSPSAGNCCSRR